VSSAAGNKQHLSMNIDIFRTILAQWVILGHTASIIFPIPVVPGRLAVWCFFIVSGYLNALSFYKRNNSNQWGEATLSYFGSRIKRIWPMLIFSYLIVSIALGTLNNNDWHPLLPYQYNMAKVPLANGVLWTLMVEIQLYALTPLIIPALLLWKRWRLPVVVLVCLFLISQLTHINILISHNPDFIDDRTVVGNVGFYLLGMMLALYPNLAQSLNQRTRQGLWILLWVMLLCFLCVYNFHSTGVLFYGGKYISILAALLVLTATTPLFSSGHMLFRFLGYYTYEIYVLHGLYAFLYEHFELSGTPKALLFLWALPMLTVFFFDICWKKKYRSLQTL
jgi:peptidoglycan/LPS O-acetylase OafA/YrhL